MRLIDADALTEEMNKKALDLANGGMIFIETINKVIDNAPTVCEMYGDIPEFHEPQKGEWIDDFRSDYEPFMQRGWKCTNCGKRTTYGKPAFCMYCGAKMEGGAEQ